MRWIGLGFSHLAASPVVEFPDERWIFAEAGGSGDAHDVSVSPQAAEPAVRRAFVQAHFRDGDASARISASTRAEIDARAGSGVSRG